MVVDLKTERDKNILKRLIKKSDALVENYQSNVKQRRGIAYESHEETLTRGGCVLGTPQPDSADYNETGGQPDTDNLYDETCEQF